MAHTHPQHTEEPGFRWSPTKRAFVSALLAFHLLAVFIAPFAFQSSPMPGVASPSVVPVMRVLGPYVDAAYLNHGYAFFAPDPGSSFIMHASMEFDDGREAIHRTLPDLEIDWPRLRYHRHFMLSEHFNASFLPAEPPREIVADPAELKRWQQRRQLYERRRAAIIDHLRKKHGADRVTLRRVEHRPVNFYEFTQLKLKLDAPQTYIERPETPVPQTPEFETPLIQEAAP